MAATLSSSQKSRLYWPLHVLRTVLAVLLFVRWTPFPYTLAFPTNVFLGKVGSEQIWIGLTGQVVWIVLGLLLAAGLWRGGLRRFVAFGI